VSLSHMRTDVCTRTYPYAHTYTYTYTYTYTHTHTHTHTQARQADEDAEWLKSKTKKATNEFETKTAGKDGCKHKHA
jgi:hypothetical protein